MPRFILDSNHFTHYCYGHAGLHSRINNEPADSVALSIVSVEESTRGRLAKIAQQFRGGPLLVNAYRMMRQDFQTMQRFPFVDYDSAADAEFRRLARLKLKAGIRDLRIAAIAITTNLIVLTGNTLHFAPIPGLVLEDWTV